MSKTKKGHLWKVGVLALVFIVPLMTAWLVFQFHQQLPLKHRSYGHLILPPIQASWFNHLAQLNHKWHIVYVSQQACEQPQQDVLEQLHRVYRAVGKYRNRLDVIWVQPEANCVGSHQATNVQRQEPSFATSKINGQRANPVLHRVNVTPIQSQRLLMALSPSPREATKTQTRAHLFIMDPQGNFMMSYSQKQPYMALYKDLKRLLKVSKIG